MKTFIVTYDRPNTITSHRCVTTFDYYVVVHNEEQRALYAQNEELDESRIVVSNAPTGMGGKSGQLNFILDNLVEPGEWALYMDDDLKGIQVVQDPYYEENALNIRDKSVNWHMVYSAEADEDRLRYVFEDTIQTAEKIGVHYCGFSMAENFFFRSVKWQTVGCIAGSLILMRDTGLRYEHSPMEDAQMVSEQLLVYGRVLINRYVHPDYQIYISGGFGEYKERAPAKMQCCKSLMARYPGLWKYRQKSAIVPENEYIYGTDVMLKIHSEKQIREWRKKLGYL